MTERAEILIVGGGLAGSALAVLLARMGRDVLLVEKGRFPRDKLCGEFLSPEARAFLADLGVWSHLESLRPPEIRRARFSTAGGQRVRLTLPGPGFGVSRLALDVALFDAAGRAGARTRTGVEIEGLRRTARGFVCHGRGPNGEGRSVESAWVVAAHGRRARLDRVLERPFLGIDHGFVGFKRHHWATPGLSADLADHVEIHTFAGGYCGMSHVESGAVNVCCLLETRVLTESGGDWERVRDVMSVQNPALRARLAGLTPREETKTLATAQVPFRGKQPVRDGVLFVGDAAAVIAPLVGDGQAMALASAAWAADVLRTASDCPTPGERDRVLVRYRRGFVRRFGVRLALSWELQRRLLSARSAERVAYAIRAVPGLADRLAVWTRGRVHAV